MATTKKTVTTPKKRATRKKASGGFQTFEIAIMGASNGFVVRECQKNDKGCYKDVSTIYVSTEALLTGIEDTVRNLRDIASDY